MKTIPGIILILLTIAFSHPDQAIASKIHQEDGIMPNHSAEYVRTLNRNASTEADAAFYNPAGLAFMDKTGLYIMFSSQTISANKKCDNKIDRLKGSYFGGYSTGSFNIDVDWAASPLSDSTYAGDPYDKYKLNAFSPVLPDLNIVYKLKDWATYFNFAILLGTPRDGAKYENGAPPLDNGFVSSYYGISTLIGDVIMSLSSPENQPNTNLVNLTRVSSITRKEMYLSGTAGMAVKIAEWVSASIGIRLIKADLSSELQATSITADPADPYWNPAADSWYNSIDPFKSGINIQTESTGMGYGVITGTNFRPIDDLNIGLRFEYYAPLKVKNNTKSFIATYEMRSSGELDIYRDGVETMVTFPSSASMGISYLISKGLRAEVGLDYYLRKYVDYGPEVPDNVNLYYIDDMNAHHRMRKDHWNNAYRIGCALEYEIIKGLKMSAGYSYYESGLKDQYRKFGTELLDTQTVGAGVSYSMLNNLDLTIGGMYIFFKETENTFTESNTAISSFSGTLATITSEVTQNFSEKRYIVALGATYRTN